MTAFPNPSRDGAVQVVSPDQMPIGTFQLLDAAGRLVDEGRCPSSTLRLGLPTSGRYILRTEQGTTMTLIRD